MRRSRVTPGLRKLLTVLTALGFVAVLTFLTGVTVFTTQVYVTDGDTKEYILTTNEDVQADFKQFLTDKGYELSKNDIVSCSKISSGTIVIDITRAFYVSVTADGKTTIVPMIKGTVDEVLTKAGITLDEDDLINIGFNEEVGPSTEIVIQRVTNVSETRRSVIAYDTEYKSSANYKIGYSEVISAGEVGYRETVAENTYVDGELVESVVLSDAVIEEPVDAVVKIGACSKEPISKVAPDDLKLDANGLPVNYSKIITGKATAYSARPGAKTASGRYAIVGTVAVNPEIIPYGTELYIASTDGQTIYGYAIAADTGTGLMENVVLVDVFMENYAASCRWGAKQVNVYILN